MPRFSDINSTGTIYSPKEFLSKVSRSKCFSRAGTVPSDCLPVYINFYQCEDISIQGYKKACLMLSGISPGGNKVAIVKKDIQPFCLVAVPDCLSTAEFVSDLSDMIRDPTEVIKMYDYHYFQIEKKDYVKITFTTLMGRRMALKRFEELGYKTFEDDRDYTNMYLRHNPDIPINKWAKIPKNCPEFKEDFFVPGLYYRIFDFDGKFAAFASHEYPLKDDSLVNSWDIETKKIGRDMTIPKPGDLYYISAISSSIGPWHDKDPYYSVVFTIIGMKPEILHVPDRVAPVIVVCPNENSLLMTYYRYLEKIRPEYEHAFNGGNFDYPIIKDRVDFWTNQYRSMKNAGHQVNVDKPITILDQMMAAYCHTRNFMYYETPERFMREVRVKLEAGRNQTIRLPRFFGSVCFDSMVLLCKAYPKIEQKNLESFLQRANLGGKEDMAYIDMHKITGETEIRSPAGTYMFRNEMPADSSEYLQGMMCKFMYYSYIDSLKLHWLLQKESFILANRALAELGRYVISDVFFKASGSVLMNMLANRAWNDGRAMSINYKHRDPNDNEEESFSGAYVVPPKYGLHRDRPVTGIDFSSLYPSLMAAFNLSPDMIVRPEDVGYFRSLGYTVLCLEIPYKICIRGKKKDKNGFLRNEICYANFIQHNGIIDPEKDNITVSRYVKDISWTIDGSEVLSMKGVEMKDTLRIIREAEEQLKKIGYNPSFVKRMSKIRKIFGRPGLFNERMGVNARLGQELFDLRNTIKAPFKRINELLEIMEKDKSEEAPWDRKCGESIKGAEILTKIELIEIRDSLNAAQLAIKVMANTIYGKSGEGDLEMYALEVAAAITYCGQNMATKPMIHLVENELYCEVQYGDTDSLYIKAPWYIYEEVISRYIRMRYELFGIPECEDIHEAGRQLNDDEVALKVKELWEPMVLVTRRYCDLVTEIVADVLCSMNGTRYLSMAYEEVGHPTYFSGKKKYAMIAHEKEINFFPDNIFLRGFDFKKRGQNKVAKEIGMNFLKKILHPGYHGDNILLMRETLAVYNEKIDPKDFVIYKTYNPDKQQVEVISIVQYMTERHEQLLMDGDYVGAEMYTPPMPGETFPYVYVNRTRGYGLSGKLSDKLKASQLAEPYRVVLENKTFTVNLSKYLEKMKGFLARLIIAEKIFDQYEPEILEDETNDDHFKRVDKARSNAAQRFVLSLFGKMNDPGIKEADAARVSKRIASRIGNIDVYQDMIDYVSRVIRREVSGDFTESFCSVLYSWIISKSSPVVDSIALRSCKTDKDVDDHFCAVRRVNEEILQEFIRIFQRDCPNVPGGSLELAKDLVTGSMNIFLGSRGIKDKNYKSMNDLSNVMNSVRILVSLDQERSFVFRVKKESRSLLPRGIRDIEIRNMIDSDFGKSMKFY